MARHRPDPDGVPAGVREGALDWTGIAHTEQATAFESEVISRRAIATVSVDEVVRDPKGAATRARQMIEDRCDRLLVHFDVDVIDFTDVPLSQHWGRNEGLSFDHALRAFAELVASPRLVGLTISELNPDHAERDAGSIERFATAIGDSLARALTSYDRA